jgi:phosphoribosyl 1,2-cyclic phosphodiesterase
MIECNYSKKILDENIAAGRVPMVQKNRLLKSHFSLKNVKDFLKSNDLSKVKEIWLLHLSDRNSNAERFKREIQEISGKPVYVAG